MLLRYFMTSNVFTLPPDRSCLEAYRELRRRCIRRAPIMDGSRLVGIVTERDLLRIIPGTATQVSTKAGQAGMDTPVQRVMTADPKTLKPTDTVQSAAQMMLTHKIGGIPVVEGDALKGLVTESDIFRVLCRVLSFETGCHVLLEEPDGVGSERTDYVRLCQKHGCLVSGLLRHPCPEGGSMVYLSIEGGNVDALVEEVWDRSNGTVVMSRTDPTP